MKRFTELKVWQRSHQLALNVYRVTAPFPETERFGLVSQIRRAVISAPANIAEGAKRRSDPDYARFLNIAEGSLAEVEALLRLSRDLDMGDKNVLSSLIGEAEEISKMVYALRKIVSQDR